MKSMVKVMVLVTGICLLAIAVPSIAVAQDAAADAAAGVLVDEQGQAVATDTSGSGSFLAVVFKSGPMALILWIAIFSAAGAAVYFVVDCSITVRPVRIMPQSLIDAVTASMAEGDVIKALKCCDDEPGPLANVLSAGFSHVEEGFEVIEDAISTSASLETEKLMQKITWLSVVGNLSPMLGLLGTVQGMIAAFGTLAGGAPDVGLLAQNISQALFTTAAGLTIAVPCVAFYYVFRNSANKIVLRMEALTMDSIKDLRHVEVVED